MYTSLLTKHNLKIPHKYAVTTNTSNKAQCLNVKHIVYVICHLLNMSQKKPAQGFESKA